MRSRFEEFCGGTRQLLLAVDYTPSSPRGWFRDVAEIRPRKSAPSRLSVSHHVTPVHVTPAVDSTQSEAADGRVY